MPSDTVKTTLITSVTSVVVALITAYVTLQTAVNETQDNVAMTQSAVLEVENSAEKAKASEEKAEQFSAEAKAAVEAIPGALATHYRGTKRLPPPPRQVTGRFNFTTRVYDPDSTVRTGTDWVLKIPADGIYFVRASYRLPYTDGNGRVDETTPYVHCTMQVVRLGTTQPEKIIENIAFNPTCAISGVYAFKKGDQVYSELNIAPGANQGQISGDFYSVFIGSGKL